MTKECVASSALKKYRLCHITMNFQTEGKLGSVVRIVFHHTKVHNITKMTQWRYYLVSKGCGYYDVLHKKFPSELLFCI